MDGFQQALDDGVASLEVGAHADAQEHFEAIDAGVRGVDVDTAC